MMFDYGRIGLRVRRFGVKKEVARDNTPRN